MWRVAIYAREAPGRAGRAALDRRVARLVVGIGRQPDWQHVAIYADQSLGRPNARPGLCRLLADGPAWFDLVVIEGPDQIAASRRDRLIVVDRLAAARVGVVELAPSSGRRFAKLVANLALADVIASGLR